MAQILFFGDSMSYGVGGEAGGAPDLIKAELHKQAYAPGGPGEGSGHQIYNLGIPGATSAMLLERAKTELSARAKTDRKLIILVSIGTNDSKNIDNQGTHHVDIATYKDNVEKIFDVLFQSAAVVIAYGFTPVDENRANDRAGSSSYFLNDRIKQFEKVFIQVAQEKETQPLPLFEQAVQESWTHNYLYSDGLHPNTAGHAWLAEKIKPLLWEELQI